MIEFESQLAALVGRKILGVYLTQDADHLQFETDAGPIAFRAEADCCSESWVNHIAGLAAILGQTITRAESVKTSEVQSGEPTFSGRQDVDSVYSYKLYTGLGICDIELRNASNGWYGGNFSPDEPQPASELRRIDVEF